MNIFNYENLPLSLFLSLSLSEKLFSFAGEAKRRRADELHEIIWSKTIFDENPDENPKNFKRFNLNERRNFFDVRCMPRVAQVRGMGPNISMIKMCL